jgi:hypothetical protein
LIPAVRVASEGNKFFTPDDLESAEVHK